MGTLLAVALFDVVPDGKQFLPWPTLLLATASGYSLLWVIGKYVYRVCPPCAVNEFGEATSGRLTKTALMLMIALGLHCTMDGLGVVFGDNLPGHPDFSLLVGISMHKLPEGLALLLLLLGAGYDRKKAIAWALGVENMTILGGLIGSFLVNSTSTFCLGILFAQVGGGFFYMIGSTVKGVLGQHTENPAVRATCTREWLIVYRQCIFPGLGRKITRGPTSIRSEPRRRVERFSP